ncbi:MAG: DNA (cytosine-5-)-methyltransferase [Caryophanon sp.]|nr:DNA (cytosine-5-)-methyltransferase [Caryophanon sp.]
MFGEQLNLFEEQQADEDFGSVLKNIGVDVRAGWPDAFGEFLTKAYNAQYGKKVKVLSLFSGAGGLDIGFHDAGFQIVSSVEIDKRFAATLMKNSGDQAYFGDSKVHCIDIRDFTTETLGDIDFIIGGPPCQTFSAAGRRAAGVMGTHDERGMLFQEYVRILKELTPQGFLFENVGGITGANAGDDWAEMQVMTGRKLSRRSLMQVTVFFIVC